jgi:hypothetical protein
MSDKTTNSRRRFLHLTGATVFAAGLAGCGGNGGDGGDGGDGGTPTATAGDGGDGGDGGGGEVPESEQTATAQGGARRNPDGLVSPDSLDYQSEPSGDEECSNCQFYVTDQDGDGMGACTLVSGEVSPQGWCTGYSPYQA